MKPFTTSKEPKSVSFSLGKFTKVEIISLVIIFLVLIGISTPNFIQSVTKARDQARKDDLGSLVGALDEYHLDFGVFPLASTDGKILACKDPNQEVKTDAKGNLIVTLTPCEWGKDSIVDLTPGSNKKYVSPLPRDPNFLTTGSSYLYISDGRTYQIYGSLESTDWDEYDTKIIARNLKCGTKVCNFGRSFSKTPTDISIEEYEKRLDEQRLLELKNKKK